MYIFFVGTEEVPYSNVISFKTVSMNLLELNVGYFVQLIYEKFVLLSLDGSACIIGYIFCHVSWTDFFKFYALR